MNCSMEKRYAHKGGTDSHGTMRRSLQHDQIVCRWLGFPHPRRIHRKAQSEFWGLYRRLPVAKSASRFRITGCGTIFGLDAGLLSLRAPMESADLRLIHF